MTALNFPDPSASPWEGPNGVTYTWVANDGNGYWKSDIEVPGNIFLSRVDDDSAEGEITFEALTTHEGGVSVTGGDSTAVATGISKPDEDQLDFTVNNSIIVRLLEGRNTGLNISPQVESVDAPFSYGAIFGGAFSGSVDSGSYLIRCQPDLEDLTASSYSYLSIGRASGATSSPNVQNVTGVSIDHASASGTNGNNGIRAGINKVDTKDNFNIFADGDAPNYLKGYTCIGGDNPNSNLSPLRVNGSDNSQNFRVADNGVLYSLPVYNNPNSNATNYVRLTNGGQFQLSTSSRRYKDNIRDCTLFDGTAAASVKQLQPRMWEDHGSGETVCGFVAEELYELGGEHMVSFSPGLGKQAKVVSTELETV